MKLFEVTDQFDEPELSPEDQLKHYNRLGRGNTLLIRKDKYAKNAVKRLNYINPEKVLGRVKAEMAKRNRANIRNPESIDRRFPEEEKILKAYPGYAYTFARDVLKGRWPEAEPNIMRDPEIAFAYVRDIITPSGGRLVRWPEAEPFIMKNPAVAVNYAEKVIRDRWPEAEQYIATDFASQQKYQTFLTKKERNLL